MTPCIIASMHPSLEGKERQQKTEILTTQQKMGWRFSDQTQLQICPFSPFWKDGTLSQTAALWDGYHHVNWVAKWLEWK